MVFCQLKIIVYRNYWVTSQHSDNQLFVSLTINILLLTFQVSNQICEKDNTNL